MRINKYIALYTELSRRAADKAIEKGEVTINDQTASIGQEVNSDDKVAINNKPVIRLVNYRTIMLNKPVGYVCSKRGQGHKTVYDLLPSELHNLNIVGRLDKDSSGLLILTNNGELSNGLTHPKFNKQKVYYVELKNELTNADLHKINAGIRLEDGISKLNVKINDANKRLCTVTMSEGKNRQIRRTFAAINNSVIKLHRVKVGTHELGDLKPGEYKEV